jgi:hypothetical protein
MRTHTRARLSLTPHVREQVESAINVSWLRPQDKLRSEKFVYGRTEAVSPFPSTLFPEMVGGDFVSGVRDPV